MSDPIHDFALIRQVVAGDKTALETLYHRHKRMVYSIALRILNDGPAAEEVAQDVFVKLWRHADAYDPARCAFTSWIYNITQRQAIDRLRANRRRASDSLDNERYAVAAVDPDVDVARQAESSIIGEQVRAALSILSPEQRRTLEWSFFAGYTHQEIADREGTPLGTVKSRLRLAFARLRSALLPEEKGGDRT